MKEPHEIYLDEFLREAKRRSKPSAQGLGHPRELATNQVDEAEHVAAEATAYHLVDQLRFTTEEAEEVVEAFRQAKFDKDTLKDTWTDFMLRRGRRR